jgi:branched-chain amino acid transport system substrate-binding protein
VSARSVLVAIAGAGLVVGCTGGNGSGSGLSPSTTTTPPTTLAVQPAGDGELRIGVLAPQTGEGASLGAAIIAAVQLAVSEINDAGGVNGVPVVVTVADEGDGVNTATAAVDELIRNDQVDAIVGPASSRVALGVLRRIVTQGVLVCSPTATAITLSTFPDADLFFRTIASDDLQARAMATAIDQQGVTSAGIVVPDDSFGRGYEQSLASALSRSSITVQEPVRFSTTNPDYTDAARAVLQDEPAVVAVIGNREQGRAMVAAVSQLSGRRIPVYVNDALRAADLFEVIDPNDPMSASHVKGLSPAAVPNNTAFEANLRTLLPTGRTDYAAYAYDCTNLIALSSVAAGTDAPNSVARQVVPVSNGGAGCAAFTDCAASLAESLNIDFNGVTQTVSIASNGDNLAGVFSLFGFDETGRDVDLRQISVAT